MLLTLWRRAFGWGALFRRLRFLAWRLLLTLWRRAFGWRALFRRLRFLARRLLLGRPSRIVIRLIGERRVVLIWVLLLVLVIARIAPISVALRQIGRMSLLLSSPSHGLPHGFGATVLGRIVVMTSLVVVMVRLLEASGH